MTKELGLGGAKLLVYALIYSFTVNDGSFFGSRGYICEACGIAMSTASKVLFELLNDGFIEKGDTTSFGTVSYIALIEDMPRLAAHSQESEKRNFENRNAEKETPPIRKSDTIIKIIIKQTYIQAYMQLARTRKKIRKKLTVSRKRGIRELKLL